jgi:RNA polymerase-binding transcription factor DksA
MVSLDARSMVGAFPGDRRHERCDVTQPGSQTEHLTVEIMTDEQRQHLEQRLLEERARVVETLDRYRAQSRDTLQEQTGNISSIPFHLADEGTDTMDEELDASEAARQTAELAEIDDALRRLYQSPDTFGRDERTGREIPFERLDLIPWARTVAPARSEPPRAQGAP